MIVIYIFKENHRFSEQTWHPGLGSVVGAADLVAGPQLLADPNHHSAESPERSL
jgi:hypothetical protein